MLAPSAPFTLRPPKLLAVVALAALAGCQTTKSRVSVDYYQIQGNSTAALDREIRRKGPVINGGKHAVAVARIKMIPNVSFKQRGSGCHVTKAKIAVDAKVTLPAWSGRKKANAELGAAWDNIDRYTRLHEAVHVALAFRYAKRMETDLIALRPAANCIAMRAKARQIVDTLLKEHDKAQRDFDKGEQDRLAKAVKKSRMLKSRKAG